ncbi:MAG: ABC transporter permease [Microbacteriaceae bacterium]
MNRLVSDTVGAFVEAWAELRIHRTRVLLSLIGVAVAVSAITAVVGVAGIAEQAQREGFEQQGRPASFYINAYDNETGLVDSAAFAEAFDDAVERYKITYAARNAYSALSVQFYDGVSEVGVAVSDVDYGVIHRSAVEQGSWFTDRDAQRLAPAVIVNAPMWERLGSPDLASHPTVEIVGDSNSTHVAVVIGVTKTFAWEEAPEMKMLYSSWERIVSPQTLAEVQPTFEVWVPPALADEIQQRLVRDIAGALGENVTVDVQRMDFEGQMGGQDPLLPFKLVVGGVAALVLFLGALSLVNISLVTLRQRIREIGIRRSFGATAGRVFFAVMMESIVGTVVAGVAGVVVAVLVVTNPWVLEQVSGGSLQDVPPFPIEAAILGLVCASAVGALAGLLPALVAVRVKVIDAIRY